MKGQIWVINGIFDHMRQQGNKFCDTFTFRLVFVGFISLEEPTSLEWVGREVDVLRSFSEIIVRSTEMTTFLALSFSISQFDFNLLVYILLFSNIM